MVKRDSSDCFHRNVHYIGHFHQSKLTNKYSATSVKRNSGRKVLFEKKKTNIIQNVPLCDTISPQIDVNIAEYVSKLVV
jgi:hypothetical protein